MIMTAPSLTEQGKSLLMRAIGGETLTFTRFKVGSGMLSPGQTIDSLTDLIDPVLAFSISDLDDTQEGLIALTGEFDNSDIDDDFLWSELGVFAKGEDNIEVLYAYSNDGADSDTMKKLDADVITLQEVTMIIAVGEAENVTAVYSPHQQYALASDLAAHVNATGNVHGLSKSDIGLGNVVNKAPNNMNITFEQAQTRDNIMTNETLSTLFGKIKKVIADVITHLTASNNPHSVTLAQVGGAAASHSHSALDINSGENDAALPVTAGGTGVKTLNALRNLIGINASVGVYTGDGTSQRAISIGFKPSAILLTDEYGNTWDDTDGILGGMAVGLYGIRSKDSSSTTDATVWDSQFTALLAFEDTENQQAGFYVNYYAGQSADENISTNKNGVVYHYIAYR